MIDELEFSNFQPHKLTILQLSPKLNVITGRTHSGKSSLVRGIKWLLQNRPRGDDFRRDFTPKEDLTSVSSSFSEGTFASREKNPNKTFNAYRTSELEEPLKALGQDVPDEVRSITKMGPENLLSQGDGYFLIGETPGKVAKKLNKVVGLEIIDTKARKIKRIISDSNARVNVLGEQIKSKQVNLDTSFVGLDSLLDQVGIIDGLVLAFKDHKNIVDAIGDLVDNIEYEQGEADEASITIDYEREVRELKTTLTLHLSKKTELDQIEDALLSIAESEQVVEYQDLMIELEPDISALSEAVLKASNKRSKLLKVEGVYKGIEKERTTIEHYDKALQSYVLEKARIEKSIEEVESRLEICPKCGASKEFWNTGGGEDG